MPALDSLEPSSDRLLALLSPDAVFIMNGGDPAPAATIASQLAKRGTMVAAFRHDVARAWDVEQADGSRNVLFESVSTTVLKADQEAQEIKVSEFGAVKLAPCPEGKGAKGIWATEIKSWLNPQAVMERMKACSS